MAFLAAWALAIINCGNRKLKDIHFSIVLFAHALFGLVIAVGYFGLNRFIFGEALVFYTAR